MKRGRKCPRGQEAQDKVPGPGTYRVSEEQEGGQGERRQRVEKRVKLGLDCIRNHRSQHGLFYCSINIIFLFEAIDFVFLVDSAVWKVPRPDIPPAWKGRCSWMSQKETQNRSTSDLELGAQRAKPRE